MVPGWNTAYFPIHPSENAYFIAHGPRKLHFSLITIGEVWAKLGVFHVGYVIMCDLPIVSRTPGSPTELRVKGEKWKWHDLNDNNLKSAQNPGSAECAWIGGVDYIRLGYSFRVMRGFCLHWGGCFHHFISNEDLLRWWQPNLWFTSGFPRIKRQVVQPWEDKSICIVTNTNLESDSLKSLAYWRVAERAVMRATDWMASIKYCVRWITWGYDYTFTRLRYWWLHRDGIVMRNQEEWRMTRDLKQSWCTCLNKSYMRL